jgi:hypothetical protein
MRRDPDHAREDDENDAYNSRRLAPFTELWQMLKEKNIVRS